MALSLFQKLSLEFLKKKKNAVILKTLKTSEKSTGKFTVKHLGFFEDVQYKEIGHRISYPAF